MISALTGTPKDPIARKKRLRQFRKDQKDQQDDKQEKILKGMKEIAKDEEKQKQKDKMTEERSQEVKTYGTLFLSFSRISQSFEGNFILYLIWYSFMMNSKV